MGSPRIALVGGSFLGAWIFSFLACSGANNHPPVLDTDTEGGPPSTYDASPGGRESGAADSPSSPQDGALEAAPDGASDGATSVVSPSKVDPSRVYFYGWINPGLEPTEPCILDPAQPATVLVGFPEHTNGYFV